MASDRAEVDGILKRIDRKEVVDLALAMGNIASPSGYELPVADFLEPWLKENGLNPVRQHVVTGRDNVVGVLKGLGGGRTLLFNSHMDTQIPDSVNPLLPPETQELEKRAWAEGGRVYGIGVVNDKGPMAAFLIAAKALRENGVSLRGDMILTMVVGEMGMAPVDEFQGERYLGKGLGTRHLVDHGVLADAALVAEATDFGMTTTEAGVLYLKLTVRGERRYTPHVEVTPSLTESSHAILIMSDLIQGLHAWSMEYEKKNAYDLEFGRFIPKANIGAIRAGRPFNPCSSPGSCSLYLDVRLTPHANPGKVVEEVKEVCRKRGTPAEVEVYLYRQGAEGRNLEPLREALESAHQDVFGDNLKGVGSPETSMWRDTNVFNLGGIPSLTYGPGAASGGGGQSLLEDDLERAAQVYALTTYYHCRA